ncbi:MAG: hypothetical protein ABJA49_06440 [Betaproteobacteria bacterium]
MKSSAAVPQHLSPQQRVKFGFLTAWLISMINMNVIKEFQARRRKVLRIAGPWILIGVVGSLIAVSYAKDPSAPLSQTGMIFVVGAFLACIIVGASIVLRHYRCPACGNVPTARYGILFGLSKCPTCGTPLK